MGDEFAKIKAREEKFLFGTYARYPLAIKKARGARLYDFNGREYVDLLAGIAVTNLGHCHPELAEVAAEHAANLVHVSNLFYQEEQLDLAERLLGTCALDKVFFCNSGAEANEAAIKLARRYMHVQGREAFDIVSMKGSFHGRTLATMTATGQDKFKQGFGPLPPGFVNVPFNDRDALARAVGPKTAAVMIEVVQGEGGVLPIAPEYLAAVKALCDETGALLIMDEVQTGLCRTGRFWAHEHYGIKPDIMTSAKALANGLPMGAMMATDKAAQGFTFGSHAATFGGGALVSAVAAKTIEIMQRDALAERAETLGRFIMDQLSSVALNHPGKVAEVRGKGLMVGVVLTFDGKEVWERLLQAGYVLNLTQERVLRLLPPLVVSEEDLRGFARALDDILART